MPVGHALVSLAPSTKPSWLQRFKQSRPVAFRKLKHAREFSSDTGVSGSVGLQTIELFHEALWFSGCLLGNFPFFMCQFGSLKLTCYVFRL